MTWVGFELHRTRQLGISQRRVDWFMRVASSSSVHLASFEEGGGTGVREAFSGPLYKFTSLHPRDSVRAVPPHVSFFLRHLEDQRRHHDCSMKMYADPKSMPWQAQNALGSEVGSPTSISQDKSDVKAPRWFSLEITRDEWPWVFEKSSKQALIISTLEALAVLVGLTVYYGETPKTKRSSTRIVPTTTDNRGHGAALNKLMTTRYPASAVLMELAAYSKKMGLKASVECSPWEANREADALANGNSLHSVQTSVSQ